MDAVTLSNTMGGRSLLAPELLCKITSLRLCPLDGVVIQLRSFYVRYRDFAVAI